MTVHLQFVEDGKAAFICDGQYGSTGKGLFAAWLAGMPGNSVDVATTNASANAGHTTKYANGDKFVTYHLPTFGVIQKKPLIYLNAGSIIDPNLLHKEVEECEVNPRRIFIHPNAAIINGQDRKDETRWNSGAHRISSTQKGVGAALARKVRREATLAKDHHEINAKFNVEAMPLNLMLNAGQRVTVEVPQGFSLGLNERFYPYCTSRQCTMMQGMSDANIHPRFAGSIAMCVRTYPIRVGSLPGQSSGDCYDDQQEIEWEDIDVEPEVTTVTKRKRRVFTWSRSQFFDACAANWPNVVFLNFVNYNPGYAEVIKQSIIESFRTSGRDLPTLVFGFGPNVEDVRP